MDFSKKIDILMKLNDIKNLRQLAKETNIPYTTLWDYYSNPIRLEKANLTYIKKIAKYLNCTIDYLVYDDIIEMNEVKLNGLDLNDNNNDDEQIVTTRFNLQYDSSPESIEKVEKLIDTLREKGINYTISKNTIIDFDTLKIPVFEAIKPNIPITEQKNIIDYIEIPKEWTKEHKTFYGKKITDNSMEPKYQKDDIVIFEQLNENSLCNGKDCIVAVDGNDATFKKVSINEQGIILQSYNASYDIQAFNNEQMQKLPVKIIGIAREKRTRL